MPIRRQWDDLTEVPRDVDVYDQAGNVWYFRERIGQRYYFLGQAGIGCPLEDRRRCGLGPYVEVIYGDESLHQRLRIVEDDL